MRETFTKKEWNPKKKQNIENNELYIASKEHYLLSIKSFFCNKNGDQHWSMITYGQFNGEKSAERTLTETRNIAVGKFFM